MTTLGHISGLIFIALGLLWGCGSPGADAASQVSDGRCVLSAQNGDEFEGRAEAVFDQSTSTIISDCYLRTVAAGSPQATINEFFGVTTTAGSGRFEDVASPSSEGPPEVEVIYVTVDSVYSLQRGDERPWSSCRVDVSAPSVETLEAEANEARATTRASAAGRRVLPVPELSGEASCKALRNAKGHEVDLTVRFIAVPISI